MRNLKAHRKVAIFQPHAWSGNHFIDFDIMPVYVEDKGKFHGTLLTLTKQTTAN